MKVKITTDRMPWAAGKPHPLNSEPDLPSKEANALIDSGFAEKLTAKKASDDSE